MSGSEERVAQYILERLGPEAEIDNTGSVSISFGEGGPHTLLAAGLDEPGYIVSGITDDGYLRLKSLAEPPPRYGFHKHFVGNEVSIGRYGREPLIGVVAAPSVHFSSERGYSSRSSSGESGLFVDIGAASAAEVAEAGVRVLDPVRWAGKAFRLGQGTSTPWASSRAGASVLLRLAEALRASPPARTVTLAFTTRQYYDNAGLLRAVRRFEPDRTVVLRPGGGEAPGVGAAEGWSSKLADELLALAADRELEFGRGSADKPSFGAFANQETWGSRDAAAVVTVGVEASSTPAETVFPAHLRTVLSLLAALCGVEVQDPGDAFQGPIGEVSDAGVPRGSSFPEILQRLVEKPGVSGAESAVRDAILRELPDWARQRAKIDAKGNLIVSLGSSAEPVAVFVAHMDEIGFEATRLNADGTLSVRAIGGGDEDLFAWRPLVLWSHSGPVAAMMLSFGSVSLGATSAEQAEALGAKNGVRLSVPKVFRRLLGTRVSARSLDDRLGCTALIAALRELGAAPEGQAVRIVFSVEEEAGLLGAAALAESLSPRRVYPVDSLVTSDSPLEQKRFAYARLGAGPVLRAVDQSGLTPRAEIARVLDLAKRNDIPLQAAVTAGGNDGSRFVPGGGVNIPLGFPLRYSHSPIETADLRDGENLARLIAVLIREELSQP